MNNKRLRIIIPMLQYYPDHPSGSTRLAFDEAVFLANYGHEVWVVTQDTSRIMPEYSFRDGLHVLQYPSPKLSSFDPRRMQIHQFRIKDLLARYVGSQVDLVHGHSLLHYDGALSLYNNKRIRKCYSLHSPVLLETKASSRGSSSFKCFCAQIAAYMFNRLERRCLERSDCITAFSHYTKSLIGQIHGSGIQQRTHIIGGWVDIERFQILSDRQTVKSRLGWPTDVPVLFTLRRLVPRMGLDRLIHAMARVKSVGCKFHLVIGGRGSLRAQLEKMVKELGLAENIRFAGLVPEETLPLMYAAADAFVLPTADLECFGLIAIEALACGRPVLATPVGAIPEIVKRFESRWLAQNQDSDAIAQLILSFLKGELPMPDPDWLRKTVAKFYSKSQVLEHLIKAVLDGVIVQDEKKAIGLNA